MPEFLDTPGVDSNHLSAHERPTAPDGQVDEGDGRLSRESAAGIPLPEGGRGSAVTLPDPVFAPTQHQAKAGSRAIYIKTPDDINAYQWEMAKAAAEYAAKSGSELSVSTVIPADVPLAASVRSSRANTAWGKSLPPQESKFARNLMVGGALALAAVGGAGTCLSIGSSERDSTPAAVTAVTSAQASTVIDAGTAPVPATSESAKTHAPTPVTSAKTLDAGVNGQK